MLSCSCGENMKVRKTINLNELILLEKVRMIYNEKYAGIKENRILTEIYKILNNKFLKLELEDNKEINDIKYIKVFKFASGKILEHEDKAIIDLINQLHKESILYEDKVATMDESDLISEEYYMEIEYKD